jgi:hypothetical protein
MGRGVFARTGLSVGLIRDCDTVQPASTIPIAIVIRCIRMAASQFSDC